MPFPAKHALSLLTRAQERARLGHAYLISGPKEARLEAFAVDFLNLVANAHHADLEAWKEQGIPVIRPESKSRRIVIESIRSLEQQIYLSPGPGGNKFGVIVDADRMMPQAQNAFLKTLEEPPPGTLLLLLSPQPQRLLDTILSRVIHVPLLPEAGARVFSEAEQQLLKVLSGLSRLKEGNLASALAIRSEFEGLLDEVKDQITRQLEEEFDKEKDYYKNTTDGQWLKEREHEMEAAIEAQYQAQREALMELLLCWMGDVMRHQVGAERLDLPEYAEATRVLSQRWDSRTVTRRVHELRRLHANLHTNVNETLALDVAFISAFA